MPSDIFPENTAKILQLSVIFRREGVGEDASFQSRIDILRGALSILHPFLDEQGRTATPRDVEAAYHWMRRACCKTALAGSG
jgi:hypothetical protein